MTRCALPVRIVLLLAPVVPSWLVAVPRPAAAPAVAAGGFHSVALKGDGTVWGWGYNGSGELGDGTTTDRATPVQASGLSGVVAIGSGVNHVLAVKADGTVWAWGQNPKGQL